MKHATHIIRAKTDAERKELEALGWQVVDDGWVSHREPGSVHMRWAGKGEPKLPKHPDVKEK